MTNNNFDKTYYKFLDSAFTEGCSRSKYNHIKYVEGLNIINIPTNGYHFNSNYLWGSFTDITSLMNYICTYHTHVAEISLPQGITITKTSVDCDQWFSSQIIITKIYPITKIDTKMFDTEFKMTSRLITWSIHNVHIPILEIIMQKYLETNKGNIIENCVRSGNVTVLKYFVDKGLQIQSADLTTEIMTTPIFKGNYDMISLLINLCYNIHLEGDYLLRHAAREGHLEIVKLLISKGADIHAYAECALRWSTRYSKTPNHMEITKILISKGADIHIYQDFPLRYAADTGNIYLLKYLLEIGANPRAKDSGALIMAAKRGYIDIVKVLIDFGANIHCGNEAPLRWSARNGYIDVVKYLLERNVNVHACEDGAIRWSAENNHIEIVKLLIDSGANIDIQDFTILQYAIWSSKVSLVKLLVEHTTYDFLTDSNFIIELIEHRREYNKEFNSVMKHVNKMKQK